MGDRSWEAGDFHKTLKVSKTFKVLSRCFPFIIILALVLTGCGEKPNPELETACPYTRDTTLQASTSSGQIESPFRVYIPPGFSVDTLSYFDSAKIADIFISLPVSGITGLDDQISRIANAQKKEFLRNIDPADDPDVPHEMSSYFEMSICSVYESEKVRH